MLKVTYPVAGEAKRWKLLNPKSSNKIKNSDLAGCASHPRLGLTSVAALGRIAETGRLPVTEEVGHLHCEIMHLVVGLYFSCVVAGLMTIAQSSEPGHYDDATLDDTDRK